jgi:hypothetical protein
MVSQVKPGGLLRDAWLALSESVMWKPLGFVVLVFTVSRVMLYQVGVRFNPNTLLGQGCAAFPQLVDPELLRSRLLESIVYLHSQPPLFNLILGIVLKLTESPAQFGRAMHLIYLALGLSLSVGLYLLLVRLGLRPWTGAMIAAALSVTPAFLLYENWLFYEYPVAALLILSALALHQFLRRGTLWPGIAFFLSLAALIYIRTIFQIVWLVLAVGLLLIARPDLRRLVLAASAVPALLVVLLLAKNFILFGVPGTSSWLGQNLARVVEPEVPLAERTRLVARGELSRLSAIGPWAAPSEYLPLVSAPHPTGIPVLDRPKKSSGCWNRNNSVIIAASRAFLSDAITLIGLHPSAYARAIQKGVGLYVRPFSLEGYLDESKFLGYTSGFNRFVLLQLGTDRPGWTIVLAHVSGFLYGLLLTSRLLLRRVEPTASAVTLAYVWLTFTYVVVVVTFFEATENGRIRFFLDPLVVVLLSAAAHEALPRVRQSLGPLRQGSGPPA